MRGTTCMIGFGRPSMDVITHQIGTRTCRIWDGKLTHTRNSLKSQFLMEISPLSSHLSLLGLNSTITYEHKVMSSLSFSPWHDHELTPSTAYTEYSIHQLQHTPSTASSDDQLSPTPRQSHRWADIIVSNSLHSHNYEFTNELSLSSCRASFLIQRLQVLLQSQSLASECIPKLARLRPPSASLSSLYHRLQVHV